MNKSHGFTLIELAVVMMIISVLAMLTTPSIMNEINQKRAAIAVEETQLIVDAARSFRISTGTWPGNATCSNALTVLKGGATPMLVGIGTNNKYNSPFSTSCTAQTFSVDQNAVADWDGYIVNSLAATQIVNAGTSQLRTTIGIPGSEPALDSKLSRIATGNAELNRMRTTLLLGGNNITEVNAIDAVSANLSGNLNVQQAAVINGLLTANGKSQFEQEASFDDVVVLNKIVAEGPAVGGCKTGALARNSAGVTLSCQSGRWASGSGAIGDPAAGWTELPNGTIMNWGTTSVLAGDARVNIYLARPCRNTYPSVSTSTARDTSDSASTTHVIPAVGLNYFQVRISGANQAVRWMTLCS